MEQAECGDGDEDGVVDEGPEEVLADFGVGCAGEGDGAADAVEGIGDECDVGGFDGDVGAAAKRDAEVGLG